MMALTPTTEVMKYAIEIFKAKQLNIENENQINSKNRKITAILPQKSKNFKSTNRLEGFFPCPRDGHTTLLTTDSKNLIIIGGDRYKVQFNDVFSCDLNDLID